MLKIECKVGHCLVVGQFYDLSFQSNCTSLVTIGSTENLPILMSLSCLDFLYLCLGCIQFDHTYDSMHHGTLEFETYPKIIPTDKLTVKVFTFCSGKVLSGPILILVEKEVRMHE